MKIVIANGTHEADFIIQKFKQERHELIVINSDPYFAEYISASNHISVFLGDPTKDYSLSDANVRGADLLIALSNNDIDNYVTCITAKRKFGVKRVFSKVGNPKRVDLFKSLGIDNAISSTYLLGESIKNESILESLVRTLTFENDRIAITEILVKPDYAIANHEIKEIDIPKDVNISCIFRTPDVIIPYGNTKILAGDKLFVVSTTEDQSKVLEFIQQPLQSS